jgi:hypothetical protein
VCNRPIESRQPGGSLIQDTSGCAAALLDCLKNLLGVFLQEQLNAVCSAHEKEVKECQMQFQAHSETLKVCDQIMVTLCTLLVIHMEGPLQLRDM